MIKKEQVDLWVDGMASPMDYDEAYKLAQRAAAYGARQREAELVGVGWVAECIPFGGYVDMPDGSSEWREVTHYNVTLIASADLTQGAKLYAAKKD